MVNKRGWIRIVEALVAILLVTGVLLVMINRNNDIDPGLSNDIYSLQISLLREIQLDPNLRVEVLEAENIDKTLPIKWSDFDNSGLSNVKTKIKEKTPNYLECEATLCELDKICTLEKEIDKNIYSQSVAIVATRDIYSPRQLKLFCWTKE